MHRRSWRTRILLPDLILAGNPFLPEDPPAPAGGGAPPPPAADASAAPPATGDPATPPAPASEAQGDGFPPGTAVKDMSVEQQAAYWRHQARKHEGRHLEALGLKPGELDTLRKAQEQVEELKRSQMSEQELAIAAARDQAATETRRDFGGRLAVAEFRAASGGRVTADVLTELRIDPSAYLLEDGEPDTAAIAAAVARLAPPATPGTPAPLDTGGGVGGGSGPSLQQQIAAAEAAGDWAKASSLKVALFAQAAIPH